LHVPSSFCLHSIFQLSRLRPDRNPQGEFDCIRITPSLPVLLSFIIQSHGLRCLILYIDQHHRPAAFTVMGTSPHKPSRHHDNTFTIGFFVNQPSTRLPLAMQVSVAHVAQPPRTLFSFFLLYGALSCPSSRLQPGLSRWKIKNRIGESRKVLLHWCNALLTSVSTALNLDRKLFFQSKMGKRCSYTGRTFASFQACPFL